MLSNMRVEFVENTLLRYKTCQPFNRHAVFKQYKCRNAHDPIFHRTVNVRINIDLTDLNTLLPLLSQFLNYWISLLAGMAPFRTEVHQDHPAGFDNFRFECCIV